MKILIVDDEALARRRLARMLGRLPDLEVIGEASDGEDALARIDALEPDLVLLDVQMPGMDGLTLARSRADLPPIVFTTAHAEHAVAAFEVAAIDYLLKPIEPERLALAIDRVRKSPARLTPTALGALLDSTGGRRPPAIRIAARSRGMLRLFDPDEVTRFHAEDKYTVVVHEGEELLLEESLSVLEARLAPRGFVRVHRAELVNLAHVRALRTEDGEARLELSDGQHASVSRRMLTAVRGQLARRLEGG